MKQGKTIVFGVFLATVALCLCTASAWATPGASFPYVETGLGGNGIRLRLISPFLRHLVEKEKSLTACFIEQSIAGTFLDLTSKSLNRMPLAWEEGYGNMTIPSPTPQTP